MFTALLARPGAAVPVDVLLDAAWGNEPPASAERTLQSHLTRLRDVVVAADADARVERLNGGYRLVLDPEHLDVTRFERLVSEAHDAAPADAVAGLREALGLWRGPSPYADLQDSAYPAAESARLTELRGSAAELLAAALLDSGDIGGAAAECEARLRDDHLRLSVLVLAGMALGTVTGASPLRRAERHAEGSGS